MSNQKNFDILYQNSNLPNIKINKLYIDPQVVKYVPEYIAKRYLVFPIKKEGSTLTIATNNPSNIFAIDDLKTTTGLNIKIVLAEKSEILKAIKDYYITYKTLEDYKTHDKEQKKDTDHIEKLEINETPAVDIVNTLIHQAVSEEASDIHLEPQSDSLKIRYRIDGKLYEIMSISKKYIRPIISRIKVLAGMNIDVKLLPQDGHIVYDVSGEKIDIRVSTLPTINGEKTVLRILYNNKTLLNLENLGFSDTQQEIIYQMLAHAIVGGILLVVGPTGSGKTTTLYSLLKILNTSEKNITTLEDPVEYKLEGINQVQINPKAGISFAKGLRSVLRQDPDIIMVGEIRDLETAEIAIRAALTGHLVLSTLHTNTASGAITRLIDMGVKPYLLSSCLVGVIAQRLVRKLCPHCKKLTKPTKFDKILLDVERKINLYKEVGCYKCNQIGFKGRTVLSEILKITSSHKKLINQRASTQLLDEISQNCGYSSLKQNAVKLVLSGATTTREVMLQSIDLI